MIGGSQSRTPTVPEGQFYRLAWAFYLLLALAGVLWVGLREGAIRLSLFVEPSSWGRDLAVGIGAAGVLLFIWEVADRLLPIAKVLEQRLRAAIGPLERRDAVGLAVLSGFAEEFFFRGAVQGSWGWPAASILFAALHVGRERSFYLWTVFATLSGLLFAWLTVWTGNLLPAILAHTIFNAVNLHRLCEPARVGPLC